MMIVSDATIWSVTYDRRLELARIINYDCNSNFIVLATVIMIINYDRKTLIVQATGESKCRNKFYKMGPDMTFSFFCYRSRIVR